MRTQNVLWRQVVKVAATNLDMQIRNLQPDNSVQMAWANTDRNSNAVTNVISTKQYKLTNEEFHCASSACLGIPNPVCIPHIGTRLVRRASEEEEDDDDADRTRRGDTVDAFGFTVSARVQQGGPWKGRHDEFANLIVLMVQLNGVPARVEPRNVVNRFVPLGTLIFFLICFY